MKCPNCDTDLIQINEKKLQCPTCVYNVMPNEKVLKDLYGWASVDQNGYEGIIAVRREPDNLAMTMVSSNKESILAFEDIARKAAASAGLKTHLIHFKRVGVIKK